MRFFDFSIRQSVEKQAFSNICHSYNHYLGSAFLLSLNAFFIKNVVKDTGALLLGFANCLVNAIVFAAAQMIFYLPSEFLSIDRQNAVVLAAAGVCVYLFFIGYYQALKYLPVWEVRLLMLGVPVVTAILAFCFIGEVLSGRQLIGMTLILSGSSGILLTGRGAAANKGPQSRDVFAGTE